MYIYIYIYERSRIYIYIYIYISVVSLLLYECTTWTLTKRREKKLDRNYTKMLRAIMNKSEKQHFMKQQFYGHLPPISKIIKIR